MSAKHFLAVLLSILSAVGLADEPRTATNETQTLYGLVVPLDQGGKNFYLQNESGQTEILLEPDAQVGLIFRENGVLKMLQERKIALRAVDQSYDLPKDLYVKVRFKDYAAAEKAVMSGRLDGGVLHADPLPDHLPSPREPWFSGRVGELKEGKHTPDKIVEVGGRRFTVGTGGPDLNEQVVGVLKVGDIRPFVNEARVYGRINGKVFHADQVLLRPIPDQTATDDPKLPRYLFIGDSISGNYGESLRAAVAGKLNIHHPPTNCGPSGKGRSEMQMWLGDYKTRGRHWDVISFNFGHWDANSTKADYQANLEAVVKQLKETGAKLVWVTTCPVPNGYPPAGELRTNGRAPGRTAGVMRKYLNPWAAEVMARHPEISVCDQWQFVKDHERDIYKEWWAGSNVHFTNGAERQKLGQFLAEHVLNVMNMKSNDGRK